MRNDIQNDMASNRVQQELRAVLQHSQARLGLRDAEVDEAMRTLDRMLSELFAIVLMSCSFILFLACLHMSFEPESVSRRLQVFYCVFFFVSLHSASLFIFF